MDRYSIEELRELAGVIWPEEAFRAPLSEPVNYRGFRMSCLQWFSITIMDPSQ